MEQGWGGTYRAPGGKNKLCWPTDLIVVWLVAWLTCAGPGGTRDGREIMTGKRARHRPRDIGRKPALALAQRGKLGGFERAKRARVAVLGGRVAQTPTSKRGTKRRTKRRKKRRKKEGKESVGVGGVVWRRFRTSTEEINETGLARKR